MAAPIADEAIRSRQALVDLLSLVDADEASQWVDRLIESQGSVGRSLTATPEALEKMIKPAAARTLNAVQRLMVEVLRRETETRPIIDNWPAVHDYLHVLMAHRATESARVLYLNSKNVLIKDEKVSEGTIDKTEFYTREVLRRALELGSAALILVHNHPSGDPTPSRQDIALTREMIAAFKPLGVRVHDHIILGTSGHFSFRDKGYI